jgi:hypothetical protein
MIVGIAFHWPRLFVIVVVAKIPLLLTIEMYSGRERSM